MNCKLVLDDWRQVGKSESIYTTPIGVECTMGDLHSGTTFEAVVKLPPSVLAEIERLWREHGAYPVVRLIPTQPREDNDEQA
jgi:hypothetical protein